MRVVFVDLRWGLTEEGGVELGALEVRSTLTLSSTTTSNAVTSYLVSGSVNWCSDSDAVAF